MSSSQLLASWVSQGCTCAAALPLWSACHCTGDPAAVDPGCMIGRIEGPVVLRQDCRCVVGAEGLAGMCRQYFQDAGGIANACYAHAWDPTGTKMFCAGGPLAFGLKGTYMGLWA